MSHSQFDVRLHRPATDSWLSVLIFIDPPNEDDPWFRPKVFTKIDSAVDLLWPGFETVAYREGGKNESERYE